MITIKIKPCMAKRGKGLFWICSQSVRSSFLEKGRTGKYNVALNRKRWKGGYVFVKRFVFLALTLMQMVFIFGMSAQQGEQSGELSNKVCKAICYVVVDGYGEMDSWTQQQYIDRLSYPVRKGAHMTEYAVLGIFLMETTYSFRFDKIRKKKGKRRKGFFGQLFWSFNIGALYACAGEYHQLYVANRAGQARDVLFDIAGLCVGLMAAYLIQKIRVWRIWRKPDFDPVKYENFAYDYGIPMRKYRE